MSVKGISLAVTLSVAASGCALFGGSKAQPATSAAAAPAPVAAKPATPAAEDPNALPSNPTFDTKGGVKPLLQLGMTTPTGQDMAQFSADELNSYLSAKLGGPVSTKLYPDANALGEALASGAIEAAWLTPPAYVRAAAKGSVMPIARLARHGLTSYRSVIFTVAKSKAKTLKDLSGKTLAWIGPTSASSGLYPTLMLRMDGKDPETYFKKQFTFADHSEVCKAVLEGKADAGATFADETTGGAGLMVDGCREAGYDPKQFKVVVHTDSIPNDVIAVRQDLPAPVTSHLQEALLEMATTDAGKTQLKDIFHADGFGKVADSDFGPVREAVKLLDANK
jgi:phosphonate transport system substrate-binding protein